jgi:hypothetical protein
MENDARLATDADIWDEMLLGTYKVSDFDSWFLENNQQIDLVANHQLSRDVHVLTSPLFWYHHRPLSSCQRNFGTTIRKRIASCVRKWCKIQPRYCREMNYIVVLKVRKSPVVVWILPSVVAFFQNYIIRIIRLRKTKNRLLFRWWQRH